MQSLPLYTSCLFSMFLNDDMIDIEKPDRIFSLTFVADNFSDYFWIKQPFLSKIQDVPK